MMLEKRGARNPEVTSVALENAAALGCQPTMAVIIHCAEQSFCWELLQRPSVFTNSGCFYHLAVMTLSGPLNI